jgi:aminoglycoside phosphotransferase (APT) family kinase protein
LGPSVLARIAYFHVQDESVIGAPFYIMERRRGVILDETFPEGYEPTSEVCLGISETVVEKLVELHSVGWREASLYDVVAA